MFGVRIGCLAAWDETSEYARNADAQMKFLRILGLTAALFLAVSSAQAITNTLVSTGSFWTYLDNGSNQGTNWSRPGFDDSAWGFGQAPLGYSDTGSGLTTIVSYGPTNNNKHVTTYFRHIFELSD